MLVSHQCGFLSSGFANFVLVYDKIGNTNTVLPLYIFIDFYTFYFAMIMLTFNLWRIKSATFLSLQVYFTMFTSYQFIMFSHGMYFNVGYYSIYGFPSCVILRGYMGLDWCVTIILYKTPTVALLASKCERLSHYFLYIK